MNLVQRLYGPRLELFSRSDLIVPLDYSLLREGAGLPDASKKCIVLAKKALNVGVVKRIAWANTSTPNVSAREIEARKLDLLRDVAGDRHVALTCKNTITEAEAIVGEYRPESVVIVCDWRHARRARKIWRSVYKGRIHVLTVDGDWSEDHVSPWCRSDEMFLAANLAHHGLLSVFGTESLRNITHDMRRVSA